MSNEALSAELDAAMDSMEENEQVDATGVVSDIVAGDPPVGDVKDDVEVQEKPTDGFEVGNRGADESVADDSQASEDGESTEESDSEAVVEDSKETETKTDDTISDGALERAVQAGLPLSSARKFVDEDSLVAAVDSLERASKRIQEQYDAQDREHDAQYDEEEPADPFADMPKLDPDAHEPHVIETFEKMKEIIKAQGDEIRAAQTQQNEASNVAAGASAAEVGRWFDKQVTELGEDFSDALGEGDLTSLSQGSSQYAKRNDIAGYMATLLAGYDSQGLQSPPREEVFRDAARHVLHDEYDTIRSRKLSKDVERRSKQHIQRAGSQKASSTQTPEEEAAEAIDAKFGGRA